MRAKFVFENIDPISRFLKPKSEEEILKGLQTTTMGPNYLLIKSAEAGFLKGVQMALERGADVHAGNDGTLRLASANGRYDVVKLLLDNGADVHAVGDGALRLASYYGHKDIIKLLKKYM